MKTVLKIAIGFVCLILVLITVVGALDFAYYPNYRDNRQPFNIEEVEYDEEITVLSANVRTWSPLDVGKKSWFYRAELMLENISSAEADIIGFQEVTKMHYNYLTETLKGYGNVITYRDESKFSEGCPVFYSTKRFELIDSGSFWLSETPEKMSKDWGAACYRICSYVILEEKDTKKQLVVFNTHLDHVSDEARINGINVVLDKIKEFGNLPSIIMGDFNAEEDSETYKAATELFLDAKYQTENTMRGATYQNWGKALDRENIDYFMISKKGIDVKEYRIVDKTYDGVYPSDHFPIELKIVLK